MTASPITAADLARLARLQVELLPGSRLSRLRVPAARAFWRFAERSSLEDIVVARRGGEIAGAGLVTLSSATLSRRLLRSRFVLHALARLPLALSMLRSDSTPADGCELVMLFTDRRWQGQGIGRRMIADIEARLRDFGVRQYVVRSEDAPGNRAVAFYLGCGFVREGRFVVSGTPFLRLTRRIPPIPDPDVFQRR
jgi:ribosomal protein S18 acetylase RimI-like enzyme